MGKKAKARLKESLEYILVHSAALFNNPVIFKRLSHQASQQFSVKNPSGFIYAFNAALIDAIENNDAPTLKSLLTEKLQQLSQQSCEADVPKLAILNFDTLTNFEQHLVEQNLLVPLPGATETRPISAALFNQSCRQIDQAVTIMQKAHGEAYQEMRALISQIIIVNVPGLYSGSTFGLLGTAFLAPAETKPYVVDYLEGLIHEAAHILLFMISIEDELFLNDPQELYDSPIRPDARPMGGLFHAYFVAARVLFFFSHLPPETDLLSTPEQMRVQEIVAQFKHVFLESQHLIARHAHLTPLGKKIFKECKDLLTPLYDFKHGDLVT